MSLYQMQSNVKKIVQFSYIYENWTIFLYMSINYEKNDMNQIPLTNLNILLKNAQCFEIKYNLWHKIAAILNRKGEELKTGNRK